MIKMYTCAALLVVLSLKSITAQQTLIYDTPSGPLQGRISDFSDPENPEKRVVQFLGVPYAEPPTGLNRFHPPKPINPTNTTLRAFSYKSSCVQDQTALSVLLALSTTTNDKSLLLGTASSISEDCLYLNIYAPELKNRTERLPTMVFIHGGDFVSGTGSLYKGAVLAGSSDVVVVNMNYRLGAFGFLSDGTSNMSGNFGLLDQREALKWVKQNIASLGGDPERITLFGEGAGGSSTHLHVLAQESQTLLNNAIIQNATYNDAVWTQGQSSSRYAEFITSLNLNASDDVTTQLRENTSTADMLRASLAMGQWHPTADSHTVSGMPIDLLQHSNISANVDIMVGTSYSGSNMPYFNLGDSSWLEEVTDYTVSAAFPQLYGQANTDLIGLIAQVYFQFYARYSANNMTIPNIEKEDFVTSLITDQLFATWTQEIAVETSRSGASSMFTYKYVKNTQDTQTNELTYIFSGNLNDANANYIRSYWTNFAKSGNPNFPLNVSTPWPEYDAALEEACRQRLNLHEDAPHVASSDEVTSRTWEFWNSYFVTLDFSCESNNSTQTVEVDTTSGVCEKSVEDATGMAISNETAGFMLIAFIVLAGVFLVCCIIATVCYCTTKKKLKKEKKKNKKHGVDNPIVHEYKL